MSAQSIEIPDRQHTVHFYGADASALARNVAPYLLEGLAAGHSTLAIATTEHWDAIAEQLARRGFDAHAAKETGQLVVLDAERTLESICIDGRPNAKRFDEKIGAIVRRAVALDEHLRLYGDMVGVLWERGAPEAAAALEGLWNQLLATLDVPLYCAYPIDIFGDEFHRAGIDPIMCAHSHVTPMTESDALEAALAHGMDRVLGDSAAGIRAMMKPNHRPAWGAVPEAESTILWLRNNLPGHADEITAIARDYFHANI